MNLKLTRLLIVFVFFILVSEKVKGQGDTEVCVGSTVSYTATPSDPENYLEWFITPGNEGTEWSIDDVNSPEINVEWLMSGSYTLTIIETDGEGNETILSPYPLDITVRSLPVATIYYAGTTYCAAGTAEITITGPVTSGTFSSTESLSIDPYTGTIDCAASIPDTYSVTYTYTDGYCYNTTNTIITINPLPDATIVYPLSPYCPSGTASPELTGTEGGNYYSTAGLSINASTGVIDLDASTPGLYTVSYDFTNGTCSNTTTAEVTILSLTTTTIEYTGSPYCGSGTALASLTGLEGGIYSGSSGLIIDNTTGTVDLALSSPGTYMVYYDYTDGVCSDVAVTEITIREPLTATISYPEIPVCTTGTISVVLTGETGGSYSSSEGLSVNASSGAINLDLTIPGTYTVVYTFGSGSCTYSTSVSVTINASPGLPAAAGPISGSPTFTPGSSGLPYSVDIIAGAESYLWTFSGTGVTINGSGSSVTLDFSLSATAGNLTVRGINVCGSGSQSSTYLAPFITLNLTSVLLQGLYNGGGQMRQANDEFGPRWPAGVADQIKVELHSSTAYNTIVYTATGVNLSTNGTATVNIPGQYNGSFYITIRHRNSIETTTAAPVSFSVSTITQSFGSKSDVYSGNLGTSFDGRYLIYGGDVDQDGFIGVSDMTMVDNQSAAFGFGYLVEDVDGDGFVGVSDMVIVDNNSSSFVFALTP